MRSAASASIRPPPPSSRAEAAEATTRAEVAQACDSVGPVTCSAPIRPPIQGAPQKLLCCGTVMPKWMPSRLAGSQPAPVEERAGAGGGEPYRVLAAQAALPAAEGRAPVSAVRDMDFLESHRRTSGNVALHELRLHLGSRQHAARNEFDAGLHDELCANRLLDPLSEALAGRAARLHPDPERRIDLRPLAVHPDRHFAGRLRDGIRRPRP